MQTVMEEHHLARFNVTQTIFEEDIDSKDFELYAWGCNDKHQLGQLNLHNNAD